MSGTAAYIRTLATDLGLADWDISIGERSPAEPTAHASVAVVWGQRRATIFLSPEWDTLSPETQRRCLVHELIHIHADPAREVLANLAGVLGGPAHDIATRCYADAEERMVDALATAVAPYLPLPGPYARLTTTGDGVRVTQMVPASDWPGLIAALAETWGTPVEVGATMTRHERDGRTLTVEMER